MTVGELIDRLRRFDSDSTVRFAFDYGDCSRTKVAPEVRSVRETMVDYRPNIGDFAVEDDYSVELSEDGELAVVIFY